jgi:FKBP-type peptidyl-prolyl cis-trans isomerase 2
MEKVEQGDVVSVIYQGLLDNNEVFDSTDKDGPLEFQIGSNHLMPGFEKAVLDMTVNEEKTITLQPEEAFGPVRQELIQTVNRDSFGSDLSPQPGMVLGMTIEQDGKKHKVPALVTEVNGDEIIIDYNHPLAGKSLTFTITLMAIQKQTPPK